MTLGGRSNVDLDISMPAYESYMRRCLELAQTGLQRGDVPVGAIVVRDDRVIAEASEQLPGGIDPAGHAEILAIRGAASVLGSRDLSGCTLYTTAEPCWMCAYAARQSNISQVVYGVPTPEVGGASSRFPILRTSDVQRWGAPPKIVEGVMADECRELFEAYRKGR